MNHKENGSCCNKSNGNEPIILREIEFYEVALVPSDKLPVELKDICKITNVYPRPKSVFEV